MIRPDFDVDLFDRLFLLLSNPFCSGAQAFFSSLGAMAHGLVRLNVANCGLGKNSLGGVSGVIVIILWWAS